MFLAELPISKQLGKKKNLGISKETNIYNFVKTKSNLLAITENEIGFSCQAQLPF